jgi:hypothetical protein
MGTLQRYKKRRKASKNNEEVDYGCSPVREQEEAIEVSMADEVKEKSALFKAFSAALFKMFSR